MQASRGTVADSLVALLTVVNGMCLDPSPSRPSLPIPTANGLFPPPNLVPRNCPHCRAAHPLVPENGGCMHVPFDLDELGRGRAWNCAPMHTNCTSRMEWRLSLALVLASTFLVAPTDPIMLYCIGAQTPTRPGLKEPTPLLNVPPTLPTATWPSASLAPPDPARRSPTPPITTPMTVSSSYSLVSL